MIQESFFLSLSTVSLVLLFSMSIVILYIGSVSLLKGGVMLAKLFHIQKYVIGLTVVALSTSMPEFFVSINAAISNLAYIPVANVIGSNILNSLFIYGIYLLFSSQISGIALKHLYFVSILNAIICIMSFKNINYIPRSMGIVFLLVLVGYFYIFLAQHRRKQTSSITIDHPSYSHDKQKQDRYVVESNHSVGTVIFQAMIAIFAIVLGTVMLFVGSEVFLESIVVLAKRLNISKKIVGLFIVSLGTSIPEFFVILVSVLPSFSRIIKRRKESTDTDSVSDIGEGNILGSNIINILLIIGSTAVVSSVRDIYSLLYENILLLLSNAMLVFLLLKKRYVQKTLGVLSLVVFAIYVYVLLVQNINSVAYY